MLGIMPTTRGRTTSSRSSREDRQAERGEGTQAPVQHKLDLLYNVKKEGAGQVLFIGQPNSGKSTLVGALSGEPLEVATTRTPRASCRPG